jgi:hypothetical protein
LLSGSDILFEVCTAGVVELIQGVLIALRVVEFGGEVAVLTVLCESNSRSNGCEIAVKG